jgi:hypothetical protein
MKLTHRGMNRLGRERRLVEEHAVVEPLAVARGGVVQPRADALCAVDQRVDLEITGPDDAGPIIAELFL